MQDERSKEGESKQPLSQPVNIKGRSIRNNIVSFPLTVATLDFLALKHL